MNLGRGLLALKLAIIDQVAAVIRSKVRRIRKRFLASCQVCETTQTETLRRILALNEQSQLCRDYQLTSSTSVEQFRQQFPITEYDFYEPYIARVKEGDPSAMLGPDNELLMLALSSGTSSESKFIPITKPFLSDYREGWRVWGIGAIDDHPGVDRGHIFQIASSQNRFTTAGGTPCGNISGLVSSIQNRVISRLYTLPNVVADIQDPQTKNYTLLRIALADESITWVMTANPGTLVHLSSLLHQYARQLIDDIRQGTISTSLSDQELKSLRGQYTKPLPTRADELEKLFQASGTLRPKDCWPRMKLLAIWTGGSAGAYLPKIRSLFGNVAIQDHGLHASEGRMTIPLRGETSTGVLDIVSHFFEFIPEQHIEQDSPQTLLAHQLVKGEDYYILMTTVSGLYRYNIRDVVRCTGFEGTTPILKFLHKGANISSITGEKVTESQVVDAVREAATQQNVRVPQFIVVPAWGDPPGYRLLVEEEECVSAETLTRLAMAADQQLSLLNSEYSQKRHSGRLTELAGQFLTPGTMGNLARYRSQRKGSSMEQYKHPCLIPDLQFLGQLPEIESLSLLAES